MAQNDSVWDLGDLAKQFETEAPRIPAKEFKEYTFYNGEVTVKYDIPNHIYYLQTPDGLEKLISSSQVGQIIDRSAALVPWACKMMANKLIKTIPTETPWPFDSPKEPRISAIYLSEFETLVNKAKTAHKDELEDAGNVGKDAHDWIENYIRLQLKGSDYTVQVPVDDRARTAVNAALNWMQQHNVRWVCTERKIYSRKYKYAGTMDGLAWIDSCGGPCCPKPYKDRLAVVDWKTSNHLHIEYILQITSYLQAYVEETGEQVTDRWLIRLGKTDAKFDPWHLEADTIQDDLDAFLEAKDLSDHVDRLETRMNVYRRNRTNLARTYKYSIACPKSKTYKGIRAPSCKTNNGGPCETCLKKYKEHHER